MKERWEAFFGGNGEGIRLFFAPGRVNLIGEHTDYTGGLVFPAALTSGTWAWVRKRDDGLFRFASAHYADTVVCPADQVVYREEDGWANYPKGVLAEFLSIGSELAGADFFFDGNIPQGAGLSSSASIEMVTAVALNELAGAGLPMIELIKMAQGAENAFLNVQCGIMDPFAVGMGRKDHAIALNCHTLSHTVAPLLLGAYRLVIGNTNQSRELAASKYNERRQEVEQGFEWMKPHFTEAECLGQVTMDAWEKARHAIQDETVARRVEHVVKENERVRRSVKALQSGDLAAFGKLMNQSHQSLKELYEVTGRHLDVMVQLAQQTEGCIGARMTGAGFGGCTVILIHRDQTETLVRQVGARYREETGLEPDFYLVEVGDGAREVKEGDPAWRSW